MTRHSIFIFISLFIFSCSSQKRTNEKELESTLLVGDFLFVNNTDKDTIPEKKNIKKDESGFNQKIDKDSLFQVVIKNAHPTKVKELTKAYKESNPQEKDFLLMMLSMPKSSKEKQIDNLKVHENAIKTLIKEYSDVIPDSLIVFIEFNPRDVFLNKDENIDLRIRSNRRNKNDGIDLNFQGWYLPYNSPILLEQIKILGWDENTLITIKNLLDIANCNSIENGDIATVGFARSGMGKYSYKFFKSDLNKEEQAKYDDGCSYIYYERNIVLEYGGGAIGQQCFEKE